MYELKTREFYSTSVVLFAAICFDIYSKFNFGVTLVIMGNATFFCGASYTDIGIKIYIYSQDKSLSLLTELCYNAVHI